MSELNTRDRVIARFVRLAIKHTDLTREAFAEEVVHLYHQRTPLKQRGIEFHAFTTGCDFADVMRANAQLVFRQLDGVTRFAAELEEAVVLALPQPFRQACLAELAGRYGLMAAALPASTAGGRMGQVGEMSKEFGEALRAISRTLEDGDLTSTDPALVTDVVRELDELIAAATTLRATQLAVIAPSLSAAPPIERH